LKCDRGEGGVNMKAHKEDGNVIRLGLDLEVLDGLTEDTREARAPERWHHDHNNVIALGGHLVRLGALEDPGSVHYYYAGGYRDDGYCRDWDEFERNNTIGGS